MDIWFRFSKNGRNKADLAVLTYNLVISLALLIRKKNRKQDLGFLDQKHGHFHVTRDIVVLQNKKVIQPVESACNGLNDASVIRIILHWCILCHHKCLYIDRLSRMQCRCAKKFVIKKTDRMYYVEVECNEK